MAGHIDKLIKRAVEHHRIGRLADADAACRSILAKHPWNSDVLNLRGMIAGQTGRLDTAIEFFREALAGAPDNALILTNLAEALRLQNKVIEAIPLFRRAISAAPGYAVAHFKHATALRNLGRHEDALEACLAGLVHTPDESNLNSLAADLLIQRQQPALAVAYLYKALARAPGVDLHWERLSRLLRAGTLTSANNRQWLHKALQHPVIRPLDIAESVASALCKEPAITGLVSMIESGELIQGTMLRNHLVALSKDTLLLELMQTTYIPHIILERVFTGLRRALLLEMDLHPFPQEVLPFCSALAIQSFLTDYAWYITDEEETLADRLTIRLQTRLQGQELPDDLAIQLTVIGAYRPLLRLDDIAEIAQRSWPGALTDLIRIQISEPREEWALREQIPRLTQVMDPVSQQVRAQYEENPYPNWTRAVRVPSRISLPGQIQSLGGRIPADVSFARPDVLIAGCGTGEQSIYTATLYKHAKILAIDFSLTSLAYAWRKTRELGITNIEYQRADIMELKGLDRHFNLIVCSGVLHHLADPLAGWQLLVDLLHPGGIMNIALYSEIAGRAVTMARKDISAKGYLPVAADIRRYRHEILNLPDAHPLASLKRVNDLFTISACRDFLFHAKEHRLSLPWIKNALAHLGLLFLGFISANTCGYQRRFPDDPHMTSLDNWHLFEQEHPDTFLEMYQFWVQKL